MGRVWKHKPLARRYTLYLLNNSPNATAVRAAEDLNKGRTRADNSNNVMVIIM